MVRYPGNSFLVVAVLTVGHVLKSIELISIDKHVQERRAVGRRLPLNNAAIEADCIFQDLYSLLLTRGVYQTEAVIDVPARLGLGRGASERSERASQ